jgi:hypothetical protein
MQNDSIAARRIGSYEAGEARAKQAPKTEHVDNAACETQKN